MREDQRMLTITVKGGEFWDENSEKFVIVKDTVLELEHSLVTLSKWEEKFRKPFIGTEKNEEELLSYIEIMIQTPDFAPEVLQRLDQENVDAIHEYLENPMSATWFNEKPETGKGGPATTAEIIYYWMTAFQIDWQAQYWHLNKLLTLIKVCNLKNAKPKKMSRAEQMAQQRALNAKRRAEAGSKG
jgi:hypothetical protein